MQPTNQENVIANRIGVLRAAAIPLAASVLLAAKTGFADEPSAFGEQILDAHNCYRAAHGVPALQWNDAVAAYAQQWVDANGFKHSKSYNSPIGPMGENLASGTTAPSVLWYGEITDPGYAFGSEDRVAGTGHLTAMLWKDAKYIGCGKSGTVISCNYWSGKTEKDCSTPNMSGCYSDQVPAPLAAAPNCN